MLFAENKKHSLKTSFILQNRIEQVLLHLGNQIKMNKVRRSRNHLQTLKHSSSNSENEQTFCEDRSLYDIVVPWQNHIEHDPWYSLNSNQFWLQFCLSSNTKRENKKTFEQGGKLNHYLKNRPLCKITTKHIVLLFRLRLHFCCKGLSESKNHIWNQVRNGCRLFRTEKTWRNVFRSHTQSERWFCTAISTNSKWTTKRRPINFIKKQLKVWRALLRT